MHHRSFIFFSLVFIAGVSGTSRAQITLAGMVADSSTMQPLPDVNITLKKTGLRTVSDLRGSFSIEAWDADSIVFSRVGYHSKALPVKWVKDVVVIFMTEENKILEPVEINDNVIPWLPKLPPESAWKNPTYDKSFTEPPGFRGIQTFGPGYILKGPISRFSKYEKERKKLKKVQKENYLSRNYVELVNDPEVKDKIIKDYDLTEDAYYRLLAVFNEKNKDIIYQLDPNDVIALLLIFYAENASKK